MTSANSENFQADSNKDVYDFCSMCGKPKPVGALKYHWIQVLNDLEIGWYTEDDGKTNICGDCMRNTIAGDDR